MAVWVSFDPDGVHSSGIRLNPRESSQNDLKAPTLLRADRCSLCCRLHVLESLLTPNPDFGSLRALTEKLRSRFSLHRFGRSSF